MVLSDVKLMWINMITPDTTFEDKWCVTAILNKEQADMLRSKKLKVKSKDGELSYVFKRNVEKQDGTQNTKPEYVDDRLAPISERAGNGSVGNIQYHTYEYTSFGGGTACMLDGLQITEMMEFSGSGSEFASSGGSTEFEDSDNGDGKKVKGEIKTETEDDVPF